MHRYKVIDHYESAYPEPLSAQGDLLAVHQKESERPGWVWCSAADGPAGWVPLAWIRSHNDGSCTLLRDYTARELTVSKGEIVVASHTESGWAWVTNANGDSGWVPLEHLAPQ